MINKKEPWQEKMFGKVRFFISLAVLVVVVSSCANSEKINTENTGTTEKEETSVTTPSPSAPATDTAHPQEAEGAPAVAAPAPSSTAEKSGTSSSSAPSSEPPVKPSAQTSLPVKMSENGICHVPGSTFYDRTTNYSPYNSLEECKAAGGREPER